MYSQHFTSGDTESQYLTTEITTEMNITVLNKVYLWVEIKLCCCDTEVFK